MVEGAEAVEGRWDREDVGGVDAGDDVGVEESFVLPLPSGTRRAEAHEVPRVRESVEPSERTDRGR